MRVRVSRIPAAGRRGGLKTKLIASACAAALWSGTRPVAGRGHRARDDRGRGAGRRRRRRPGRRLRRHGDDDRLQDRHAAERDSAVGLGGHAKADGRPPARAARGHSAVHGGRHGLALGRGRSLRRMPDPRLRHLHLGDVPRRPLPETDRLLRLQDRALRPAAGRGPERAGLGSLRRERRRRHDQRHHQAADRDAVLRRLRKLRLVRHGDDRLRRRRAGRRSRPMVLPPDRPLPRRLDRDGRFRERPHLHRAGGDVGARCRDLADDPGQLPVGPARAARLPSRRRRRLSRRNRRAAAQLRRRRRRTSIATTRITARSATSSATRSASDGPCARTCGTRGRKRTTATSITAPSTAVRA